jgi:predicted DNA-binding transcriptional regulator AlpA
VIRTATIAPRGLRREDAARYVGVSPSMFDRMVAAGQMPPPRTVASCRIWDRQALDSAFDDLPTAGEPQAAQNPFDNLAV